MDPQAKQILEWSGEPERAMDEYNQFSSRYKEETGHPFDLEPVNSKRLLSLFGNSRFLSRYLTLHPREADLLAGSPWMETDKDFNDFSEELDRLLLGSKDDPLEKLSQKITRYKYREYLRLTVKDLSQAASQESILRELSDLARTILQKTLQIFLQRMETEFGKAFVGAKTKGETDGFCIIAQGKLGGRELNYSSDVDLQYIYLSDQATLTGSHPIGPHEFFVKLSERLTQFLSQRTEDGFLYRVDLNLRPEGRSGTLANSLSALENYYETFGQPWERQALIKAAPVAGDEKVGKNFLAMIEPFVWRRSFDLKSIEEMKEMKRKIHESAKGKTLKGFNVKLDEGGIREIEFFVQILQLLYGGKHLDLRSPSTLETLEKLKALNLLGERETNQLTESYLFLRRLEHRLQVVHEEQIHVVPVAVEDQRALARRMGYFEDDPEEARESFLDDLTQYTTMVKNAFKNLFE